MNHRYHVLLIAACLLALAVLPASAEGKAEKPVTTAAPAIVPLTLITVDGGRVYKEDNPVVLEIEKRTNVKLDYQLVPLADFPNRYNVLAASGNIPDISRMPGFTYQQYAAQGLYLDVGSLVDKYAPNLKQSLKPELWDLVKYNGRQVSIPYENSAGKLVHVVRQDWLDKLGIAIPATLDAYVDMLRKFTLNDPDGNAKNDTYGTGPGPFGWAHDFAPIFGTFGFQFGQPGQPAESFLKDGKIYTASVSAEYKAALELISRLWAEKLIDPDLFIVKTDQAYQKLVQSKYGSFCSGWSIAPVILMQQMKMKDVTPAAKWSVIFPEIKGLDGKGGLLSWGNIANTVNISAKCKNPEAAVRFLDYLASPEGWELAGWGIKGVHYTELGKPRTEEGTKAANEKWLDALSQIVFRLDLVTKYNEMTTDPVAIENNRFALPGNRYRLYQNIFFGIPATEEQNALAADVANYELEMAIKFITGTEPFSKWNDYVNTWKAKGGQKILESKVKLYNQLKGTSYTAGS